MLDGNKIVDIYIEMTQNALNLLRMMDLEIHQNKDDPFIEIVISADSYESAIGKQSEGCGFKELVSATLELYDSKLLFKNISNHWGARIISSFDIYESNRSVRLVSVQSTVKWLTENYNHLVKDQ